MVDSFAEGATKRYETTAQEDRCAPRARVQIPARLRMSGANRFETVVHDLSLAGFSAAAVSRVHPGTVCWLTLPGLESLQSEVVWWRDCLVGCAFDQLLNPAVLESVLGGYSAPREFRSLA
ncbi:MAG: PilZ domain-containing protein [Sphingomonadaceae bacterium]